MKRTLLVASLLVLGGAMAYAGPQGEPPMGPHPMDGPCCARPCPNHCGPKVDIEQKLKLTPDQKARAKALRMEAREQMRPIMEAIKTKKEQKEIIKHNRSLTAAAQCEQVEKLNNQINELKRQARDIRIKNERDFEALLTAKQKKELAKIRENARKEMMKNHKKQPPKCPPRCPQK